MTLKLILHLKNPNGLRDEVDLRFLRLYDLSNWLHYLLLPELRTVCQMQSILLLQLVVSSTHFTKPSSCKLFLMDRCFLMFPSLSIGYCVYSSHFVNALQLARNIAVVEPFYKLSELPNSHIEGQWIRIFVKEVSDRRDACWHLLWIYIAINGLYNAPYHIFLSHLATERRALGKIIIEPSLHPSSLIDPNHRLVDQEAASIPRQLRKAFETHLIQMQAIWVRNMFNIHQPDGYSLQIQRLPVMRRTKLLS